MDNVINYMKRKNKKLFKDLETSSLKISKLQTYTPIHNEFFDLNNTNYNSVEFTNHLNIEGIKEVVTENHLLCSVNDGTSEKLEDVYCKYSALLDPFKYMIGKYNIDDNLYNLPSIDDSITVHSKLNSIHNSSYVDSFFVYLTHHLLNKHNFIHGLQFYGNYLGIKEDLALDVLDDIDYITKYHFFNKNKNVLFDIPHFHLNNQFSKPVIQIGSLKSVVSMEDLSDNDSIDLELQVIDTNVEEIVELEEIKETEQEEIKEYSPVSSSNCSSRTSYTDENPEEQKDNAEEEENSNDEVSDDDVSVEEDNGEEDNGEEDDDKGEEEDDSVYTDFSNEQLLAYIKKMPVNIIMMEKCKNTMDSLFTDDELSTHEWISSIFQIIMTLITYQKMFKFTHNDLHTNNIMYQYTKIEHLYYTYDNKKYKVKTYGRIFKIIDFGRSIFTVNNKLFCSDSFDKEGDASTQYNFPPFYNPKKKLLEPNYSFDLCRLGCSIFDFIFDDINDINNDLDEFQQLIVDWCKDDKGVNILYKKTGEERYEDFKLYRMISKNVHGHIPSEQLNKPQFKKFLTTKIPNNVYHFNIDEMPEL